MSWGPHSNWALPCWFREPAIPCQQGLERPSIVGCIEWLTASLLVSHGFPATLISYIVGSNSRTQKSCKHARLLRSAYCDFHFCVIFVFSEVYSIVDGWVLSSPSTCWRVFDMFNPILAPPWNPINGFERTNPYPSTTSKSKFKPVKVILHF